MSCQNEWTIQSQIIPLTLVHKHCSCIKAASRFLPRLVSDLRNRMQPGFDRRDATQLMSIDEQVSGLVSAVRISKQ